MVYFCADDYGISDEYNRRIEECVDKGSLNKVSVLPNGRIDGFVEKFSDKDVLLTLHLNLVEGRPLSPLEDISLLVDENGCFKYSFIGLFKIIISIGHSTIFTMINAVFLYKYSTAVLAFVTFHYLSPLFYLYIERIYRYISF